MWVRVGSGGDGGVSDAGRGRSPSGGGSCGWKSNVCIRKVAAFEEAENESEACGGWLAVRRGD